MCNLYGTFKQVRYLCCIFFSSSFNIKKHHTATRLQHHHNCWPNFHLNSIKWMIFFYTHGSYRFIRFAPFLLFFLFVFRNNLRYSSSWQFRNFMRIVLIFFFIKVYKKNILTELFCGAHSYKQLLLNKQFQKLKKKVI